MTDLVVCLGTGKGTWNYINNLITAESWGMVLLITNDFGKENFKPKREAEFILVDDNMMLPEMVKELEKNLGKKLNIEVAVNLVSGSGKEHMAILSALLKLGLAIRLVSLTQEGVREL